MTLMNSRFIDHEYDRMVVRFSMHDGDKEIPCAISTAAMDDLENGPRAKPEQREAQFNRLRGRIETHAASKYQATEFEGSPPGIVLRSIDFRTRPIA